MAVESRHLSASLRCLDDLGIKMRTYSRIRPDIQAPQVESFLQAISMLSEQTGANAFLTINTQLVSDNM